MTITVREVLEGYRDSGLKPTWGNCYQPFTEQGCALGAVYANRFGIRTLRTKKQTELKNDFVYEEVASSEMATYELIERFGMGFDAGYLNRRCGPSASEYERLGRKAGRAVRLLQVLAKKERN